MNAISETKDTVVLLTSSKLLCKYHQNKRPFQGTFIFIFPMLKKSIKMFSVMKIIIYVILYHRLKVLKSFHFKPEV